MVFTSNVGAALLRAFFASSFAFCLLAVSGLAHAQSGFGGGAGVDLKSLLQGIPATTGAGGAAAGAPGQEEQADQSGAFRVVPRAFRPYTTNEFQRFVEQTLGQRLPLYGQELFELEMQDPMGGTGGAETF